MAAPLLFLNADARLLDRIRKGDEAALVTLYDSNRRAITSFVTRNSGNRDDAEDMLQEALVILWERVRSGRFELTARLNTFIFATVKNMWMRRLSEQRRAVPLTPEMADGGDNAPDALEEMMMQEEAQRVRDALKILGEPCRRLLLLFYWEEQSMEEIAAALNFANADTVKSKKYQCKKALEKILGEMS